MERKTCKQCGVEKDVSEFYTQYSSVRRKRYYLARCKPCHQGNRKLTYHRVAEKTRERTRRWKKNNRERSNQLAKSYRIRRAEHVREYHKKRRLETADERKAYNKQYRDTHKEQIREYQREYLRKKRANNPQFKLGQTLRSRIRAAVARQYQASRSVELLGCSIPEYMVYLEARFTPEMSWDNYGTVWTIDHIKPCRSFDLTDPEQQKACFNHSNTQPLLWQDNRSKNDKWNGVRASLSS